MLNNRKLTAEVARWALAVEYDRIPPEVIRIARYQILGMLGSVFGSLKTAGGKKIVEYIEQTGKGGDLHVPLSRKKVTLKDALRAYASLSMLLDYDDYLFMGHTGHSAVWVSLLGGLLEGKDGREILTGVVIGNEIGGRLGGAVLLGPHNGQMWSFIHGVNSSLIMGRFRGLDFEQILGAISLYLYQPHYPLYPGFMGSDAKIFTAVRPIIEGLESVELARFGFHGHDRILEIDRGFLANFSVFPLDFFISDFGRSWLTETLAVKLYPGCAYIDTTIDALRELKEDEEFPVEKIRRIKIDANLLTYQMNRIAEEYFDPSYLSAINVNFNLKINVAIMLITGDLRPEYLDEDFLMKNRRKILSLADRIEISHSWLHTFDTFYNVLSAMDWEKLFATVPVSQIKSIRDRLELLHGEADIEMGVGELLRIRKLLDGDRRKFFNRLILKGLKNRFTSRKMADFSLADIDFKRFKLPFGVRVSMDMEDGRELETEASIPRGVSYGPDFEKMVVEKFRREAEPFLSGERIDRVVDIVENFEENNSYTLFSAMFD